MTKGVPPASDSARATKAPAQISTAAIVRDMNAPYLKNSTQPGTGSDVSYSKSPSR